MIQRSLMRGVQVMFFAGVLFALAPMPTAFAQNGDTTGGATFENPLKQDTVEGVLGDILEALRKIVAVLALVFLVVGAILYITSGGDQGRTTLAKAAIFAAIIGLAVALAAPTFLKEIYDAIGDGAAPGEAASAPTLSEVALNILKVMLSVVGILAMIMLVVGGIFYMASGGDETRIETAKKMVLYSIIGLVVALTSLIIVTQLAAVFAP